MNRLDFSIYMNWVVYAVVGRMAEADQIYKQYTAQVESAARHMTKGIQPMPYYRGLVLGEPGLKKVEPDIERTFISFSGCREVAMHFGDPDPERGFGFGPFPMLWPHFVDVKRGYFGDGYLIEYQPSPEEILFHYSLFNEPSLRPLFEDLFSKVGVSEDGAGALNTFLKQREIILLNRGQVFSCQPFKLTAAYIRFVEEARKVS